MGRTEPSGCIWLKNINAILQKYQLNPYENLPIKTTVKISHSTKNGFDFLLNNKLINVEIPCER